MKMPCFCSNSWDGASALFSFPKGLWPTRKTHPCPIEGGRGSVRAAAALDAAPPSPLPFIRSFRFGEPPHLAPWECQIKTFPFASEFPLEAAKRRQNTAGGQRSAAPGRNQTPFKPGTGGRMGTPVLPPLRGLIALLPNRGFRFAPPPAVVCRRFAA